MWKVRFWAVLILLFGGALSYFVYTSESDASRFPFRLGLDLSGGSHLVYKADVSGLASGEQEGAMEALRDVIERRVNLFGVSEPIVQAEKENPLSGGSSEHRLIVELPGVTDLSQAISLIGQTPLLEFKVERPGGESTVILEAQFAGERLSEDPFLPTELTGRYLERALLEFDQTTREPIITLVFNAEGARLFAELTKNNIGKIIAIYLDGNLIQAPVVRESIPDGRAQITGGGMTPESARESVRNLNYGALPVPIDLLSTQTVGASLGEETLSAGVKAGVSAFIVIALFLVFWYRLPGLVAVFALVLYVLINLALFKLIPVTLTAAGIAAFILSIGMAVDANILIFERTKEELRRGKPLSVALHEGFARAWPSIRDSNISSIITAIILFWFASSAMIKGFALVFGIGVFASMFSAITATRLFLYSLGVKEEGKITRFLFGSGLSS